MATVRVAPGVRERLVQVALSDVDERVRGLASRALREKLWREELDPTRFDVPPTMGERLAVLDVAIRLERAAAFPSGRYRVSEEAARKVLG